jgi:hypothetical protein
LVSLPSTTNFAPKVSLGDAGRWATALAAAAVLATACFCHDLMAGWPGKILAVPAALMLAYFFPMLDRFLCHRLLARYLFSLTWAGLVTAFLFQENLQAQWGIIDDHEIMAFQGPQGKLSRGDWLASLATHPEILPTNNQLRFRPAYYSLRLTECMLWGNNPHDWYAARLVFFWIALTISWNLMWQWWGSGVASFGLLGMLTYGFWGDIWCRLGPAETYAVLGCVLFVAGAAALLRNSQTNPAVVGGRRRLAWSALLVGGVVAMGSKENFLPLLPCTWALAGWLCWQRRLGILGTLVTLLLTGVGSIIAYFVVNSVAHAGHDIYYQDVGILHRLRILTGLSQALLRRGDGIGVLAGLASLAGTIFYVRRQGRLRELRPWLIRGGLALILLAALFASQYFFYSGNWPGNSRYDFPGLLALPLMGLCVAWMGLGALAQFHYRWLGAARAGLLAMLAAVMAFRGFSELHNQARTNANATKRFAQDLNNVVARLQEEPSLPVLFVSHQVGDIEPIASVRRFLRARQVVNPLYFRLAGYDSAQGASPQVRQMTQYLETLSQCGDGDQQPCVYLRNPNDRFQPLPSLPDGAPTFQLDFLPNLEFQLNRGTFCNKPN